MNRAMASLPTGITSAGLRRVISACSQRAQLAISAGLGTRSPPRGFLPGKHRHTAVMYIRERNPASSMPQASSNHLNIALPAVQANGRCKAGSLSPGAWPTSITRLATAAPVTGADCIAGHRRQARRAATCCSRRCSMPDQFP